MPMQKCPMQTIFHLLVLGVALGVLGFALNYNFVFIVHLVGPSKYKRAIWCSLRKMYIPIYQWIILSCKYNSRDRSILIIPFYVCMVESHEMDSLLKLIFSNPNGIFTCYSMYLNRQSIKVMDDNLHS